MAQNNDVVTIQRTSKSIKLQQVIATMVLLFGALLLFVGFLSVGEKSAPVIRNGWLTVTGGAVWSLGMKMAAWWHHA